METIYYLMSKFDCVFCFSDPRTDPWPLVHSPLPVTLLFAFYLLVVALGPFYMRNQKPLKLRGLLVAYNLSMMMLSSYMFYEVRRQDCLTAFPCDARQMARVCWWFFFSKVIELLDTVFIILRKKQEQVTFLHVYHHGTMLFNWWSGVKYVPGGQAFFIGMLNSFVHIFMYGYYALASLGPQMHCYLWWKRYLTIMQHLLSVSVPSLAQVFVLAVYGNHHVLRFPNVSVIEVNWMITGSKWYSQETTKRPSVTALASNTYPSSALCGNLFTLRNPKNSLILRGVWQLILKALDFQEGRRLGSLH
uniref:Elongation of very long chain fatty acids protein n=1 Tax=Anas zonorhyncha TaxID=75864 RepID=A0A8B9UI71_9AVES